jgi:hypothetical protein
MSDDRAFETGRSEKARWLAGLLAYGFFGLSGLGRLLFCGGGRLSLRFSMTTTGSLGGRLSWSFRWANAQAAATTSITSTTICRINLIVLTDPPRAKYANRREKETRRQSNQQARCHERPGAVSAFLREKSNKTSLNSHGFEFGRTESCSGVTASL